MARLPAIADNTVLTQNPRSSVSASDVADPFLTIAGALDGIGKAFEQEGLKDAAVQGSAAVVRDEAGNLKVERSPYPFGKRADMWERAAGQSYIARSQIDDRAAAQKFAIDANGDSDTFQASWKAYAAERAKQAPEMARADVQVNLEDLGSQTVGGLIAAKQKRDNQVYAADQEALADARRGDILSLARAGGTSSKEFKTALSQYRSLRTEMINNPDFAYSQTQYDLELKQLESAARGESMIGNAERIYETEGPRAAIDYADSVLTKTDLGLSPGTARTLNGLMRSRIEDLQAGHAVDMKGVEDQADNLVKLLDQGEAIDNPMVDQLAEQLARGGKGAKAAELLRKRTVAERAKNRRAEGVTPGDRVAELERLRSQAGGERNLPIVTRTQAGRVSAPDMDGVEPVVIDRFRQLQNSFGRSIPVVSGFRDRKRNAKSGGAKHSQHLGGNALDLDVSDLSQDQRVDLIRRASASGFTGIGVYANSLHVDVGSRRAWGASHHGDSVPAWAKDAIAEHMGGKIPLTPRAAALPNADDVADARKVLTEEVKITWPSIKAGWERYGTHDSQELTTFAKQLPWLDDDKLRTEITTFFGSQAGARIIDALPPVERANVLTALNADAADGATVAQLDIINAAERQQAARATALADDPQEYSRRRYSSVAGSVPPIDMAGGADAFATALTGAQRHADLLAAREGTGPVSAFTKAEQAAFTNGIATMTPGEQAQALGVMQRTLKPATYMATLGKLAAGNGQGRALAVAGAVYQDSPAAAEGILRGRLLLRENAKLAPAADEANRVAIDEMLPPRSFVPGLEGPRQDILEAATARYADLSSLSGDTSAELNDERMTTAISEVTGGLLDFNGEQVIAPVYGMTQQQFDAAIKSLSAADLAGAVTMYGDSITPDQVRSYGRLRSVGTGAYAIEFGSATGPTYAIAEPTIGDRMVPRVVNGPFVLHMGDH